MRKIQAVESFAKNKNSVISGDQSGNLLAQVETFNMVKRWTFCHEIFIYEKN